MTIADLVEECESCGVTESDRRIFDTEGGETFCGDCYVSLLHKDASALALAFAFDRTGLLKDSLTDEGIKALVNGRKWVTGWIDSAPSAWFKEPVSPAHLAGISTVLEVLSTAPEGDT